MSEEGFHLFLGVMCVIAFFVFIALYFVKAGYGMFRTASWGYSISNKVAWVLMEAPVFIVMFWLWGRKALPCRYIFSSCCSSYTTSKGRSFFLFC